MTNPLLSYDYHVTCMCLLLQPVPLFSKIEESTALKLKERFAGKQQDTPVAAANTIGHTALQERLDKQVSKEQDDAVTSVSLPRKSDSL